MFHEKRTLILVLALSLLSAACAGERAESAPAGPKLTKEDMKYVAVFVDPFTIAAAGVKEKEPGPHLAKAQEACLGQLVNTGLFDSVKLGAPSAPVEHAIVVKAELVSLRIVGGGARFWLGAMAGKSDMLFNVTLVDAGTGAEIGKSSIGQDSNPFGGAWTMGGTDRSVPAETGGRIAEYVVFGAKR
jgi:hypothetical protein